MFLSEFCRNLGIGNRRVARANRGRRTVGGGGAWIERLESRLVLSTWSGADSGLWSDPGNWDTLPTTGSDLVFPATATNLATTDDLTGVTSFGSLTIAGSGYSIAGTTGVSFTSIDSSQSSGTNNVSVPLTLAGTPTVKVDEAGAALVVGGVVSGSGGLTKAGDGTLNLTQANTFTGTTTVTGGTIVIDGAQAGSPVTLDSGSTLGGVGTVGGITGSGGTVSPGDSVPGTLIDTGALTLGPDGSSNNSNFAVELNGTAAGSGYSQLQVAGQINLSGVNLSITLGSSFTAAADQNFEILDNTGTSAISGTFAGLAEGSTVVVSGISFVVSYLGGTGSNSVVLTELATSSTALEAMTASPVFGQPVALQATVTSASNSGPTPAGTVEFLSGSVSLGLGVLNDGVATLSVSTLPVGANNITAEYQGDTNYGASTSSAVPVTVGQAASTATVTFAPDAPVWGESVTLTATVAAVSPGAGTPTGTVEFFDGTTSLGTGNLSGGVATLETTGLPVGTDAITAQYSGDVNFTATTSSPAVDVPVAQAATTSAVTFFPLSPIVGQSVLLTATISVTSPGSGTLSGTVEFFNGMTSLGTATVDNSGVASLATTALPAGDDSLTATYLGDTNFAGSAAPAVSVTVAAAATSSTMVTFTPAAPVFGENVTLTAAVLAVSPLTGTPSGTVQFFNGSTSLGEETLNDGLADIQLTTLPVDANSITAVYSGDGNFTASTSPAVTVTVAAASTTTTVTSAPMSATFGESVTLTATVAAVSPGAGTPGGTVTFFNGTDSLGTGTLSGGVATLDLTTLPVAGNSITAQYTATTDYLASTSTAVTVTVAQASTSLVTTFSPADPVSGQSVTLTATISVTSPGGGIPTGEITFLNGTTSLGIGTLDDTGVATLAITSLPVAANAITAQFAATTDYGASTSPAVTVTVAAASTTTTVAATPSSPDFGQTVTLTATVAAASPGAGTPTGTVTFFNGTTSLGTGTLDATGVATLATSALPVATNSITAVYETTTDFLTSTSPAITVTVVQTSTSTVLSFSPGAPVFGQSVTLTATVSVVSPGSGTPTGTVTFLSGTTTLGTGTLDSSDEATLAISSLPIGESSLTAEYAGDSNFPASTSAAVMVTISQASTTTTVVSSPASPAPFEAVTLSATVAAASPGAGTPTGMVTFFSGTTALGTASITSGTATLSTSALAIGDNAITATYNGDANFTSGTSTEVDVVVGTANEQWLNTIYEVDLNRAMTQSDLSIWDQQLTDGRTRAQVAFAIGNSKEAQETIVQDAFELYLGRSATPAEVTTVIGAAAATDTSPRAIILGSHEFFEDSGGTIKTYVAALETAVYGQAVGGGILAEQLARGVLPAKVAEEVLLSTAGKAALLTDTFQNVLGRSPSSTETTTYVAAMNQGAFLRDIQAYLLASDEYYNEVVVSLAGSSSS